jgi:GT2 family glycosyltransferase
MIDNVFITIALRADFIYKMVDTLYKYTPHNFKLVLVDMTKDGLPDIEGVHLKLRPHRNLGFAKGMNEGIIHALHWNSTYITCLNDDIEFMNSKWWDGIMDTFAQPSVKEVLVVAPESPRIPMWGYGMTNDEYVEVIEHKDEFSEEDYQFLLDGDFSHLPEKYDWLPESFPLHYVGVCDAMATWGPVCKRKLFTDIGLWDERFYPGSGEDYDMMGRIYSKGYRAVSTRGSWVWHWWGKSKEISNTKRSDSMPLETERIWNKLGDLWPPELNEGHNLDVWGFYTNKKDERVPLKRISEIAVTEI